MQKKKKLYDFFSIFLDYSPETKFKYDYAYIKTNHHLIYDLPNYLNVNFITLFISKLVTCIKYK